MRNRRIVLFALVMLITSGLAAQEQQEMRYLFDGQHKTRISGFGGPFVSFSPIQGEFGVMAGGGGGILVNQRFIFGGYGMGLSTIHYYPKGRSFSNLKDPRLNFGHGGFMLGYIPQPTSVFHLSFSSLLGWGAISLYDDYDQHEDDHKGVDNVFVFEPKAEAELNLTRWFKINLGLGYRFVTGVNKKYEDLSTGQYYPCYESSDFSSPVASIHLLFGGFR